jgi:RING finger protein 113A
MASPPPAEKDKDKEAAASAPAAEAAAAAAPAPPPPPPSEAAAAAAPKPRKVRGNLRKRDDADGDDDDETAAAAAKRAATTTTAAAGTKHDLAFSSAARPGGQAPPSVGVAYASSRAAPSGRDAFATAELATETEFDRDARAVREKALAAAAAAAGGGGGGAGGGPSSGGGLTADQVTGPSAVYRGAAGYSDFKAGFRREGASLTGADNKATGAHGPLRASLYVRTTARFDYQPDVCKDYKETGYCAYGDSCKFLHDRGDHKSGWEVERDWEKAQRAKRERRLERRAARLAAGGGGGGEDDDDEDDDDDEEEEGAGGAAGRGKGKETGKAAPPSLPFACLACRVPWLDAASAAAVQTRCGHYFCERCALGRQARGQGTCAACDQPTQGVFNAAPEVLRAARRAAAAAADKKAAPGGRGGRV